MIVRNYKEVNVETVGDGAVNTTIRWLIAEPQGAQNFYMRLLEIGPGGKTPEHSHDWEHEVFIIEGEGNLEGEDGKIPLKPGDSVYVPGGVKHFFESSGDKTMKMLCLIPSKK